MTPTWTTLGGDDRAAFWAAVDFLKHRLSESETIEWALHLRPDQRIERMAISHLLDSTTGPVLEELQKDPWATAWRLIQENWSRVAIGEHDSPHLFDIGIRLHAGDRSGPIVTSIVNLVAPRLKVEPIDSFTWRFIKKPRRPKKVEHLLSASLTSGHLLDLDHLRLSELIDTSFLVTLANALEAAVNHGLDVARRIGWNGISDIWQLGPMYRVRYARYPHEDGRQREPDAAHRGIAPSVKLLHAVVTRLGELEPETARQFVKRWRLSGSPVHIRLWSEPTLNCRLISAQEVEGFLLGLSKHQFWELHEFPEIAELRALRFSDLELEARRAIVRRIRRLPPYNYWPREVGREAIKDGRLYWAVREARRIEIGGGDLSSNAKAWLRAEITRFPDLVEMEVDEGLPVASRVHVDRSCPDERFDTLYGVTRLRSLETALSAGRGGSDYPAVLRAGEWLARPENAILVLGDLESAPGGGEEFPVVWKRLGWTHTPTQQNGYEVPERDLRREGERVLDLMGKLSEKTVSAAVAGISNWLSVWSPHLGNSEAALRTWLRVWPIAVKATDDEPQRAQSMELNVLTSRKREDREVRGLGTLNSPTGRLVSAFLFACPSLAEIPNPFLHGSTLRVMRDAIIDCTDRSGLISRYRLLEHVRYFLQADRDWTQQNLIDPLFQDDDLSIVLWQAAAQGTLFSDTLTSIGGAIVERATDRRLGRETRTRLVFSLIIESLHAFRESRSPAVSNPRIQQMLRSIDDEIRADAADAILRFVLEVSEFESEGDSSSTAATILRSAAAPFLTQVWPLERSLATPGVSRALARLPATSGEGFAEAVETIERFLVPFECWSMLEYGLYGDDAGKRKLSVINDETKARALLRLLDLTVGTSEDATVPHDLTDALDQIRLVAPGLVSRPAFRRLSTAARR